MAVGTDRKDPAMDNGQEPVNGDSNIAVLRAYFPGLTMGELKNLTKEDRTELATAVAFLPEKDRGFALA